MQNMDALVKGALLHDIGKIVYRAEGKPVNHSTLGKMFLQERMHTSPTATQILHCVAYHHGKALNAAHLPPNDIAYIVYEADNLASAADRRERFNEGEENTGKYDNGKRGRKFDAHIPLTSIFSLFGGRDVEHPGVYPLRGLGQEDVINYPTMEAKHASADKYKLLLEQLDKNLKPTPEHDVTDMNVHEILRFYEDITSYVPSSTDTEQVCDISLYTHSKVTAAIAADMALYFEENNINNYKEACFVKNKEMRDTDMFLMISGDMSGIQDFIYTIPSKGALKSLRGRSFYLEIFMEAVIDELLEACRLSRVNLLYAGGGHFYILAPNTEAVKRTVNEMSKSVNMWLLNNVGDRLYMALGYAPCTGNELIGERSQQTIFSKVSRELGQKKLQRYDEEILKDLFDENSGYNSVKTQTKECVICHTSVRRLVPYGDEADSACPVCAGLYKLGKAIVESEDSVFVITTTELEHMPNLEIYHCSGHAYLNVVRESLLRTLVNEADILRIYVRNKSLTGTRVYQRIWLADHVFKSNSKECKRDTVVDFAELVQATDEEKRTGIKRIGVLRADVDDLGAAFMSGFVSHDGNTKYVTLSRQAELSRSMSLFFKLGVNQIAKRKQPCESFSLWDTVNGGERRKIHIIYSGGDDVCIVGDWSQVLELAVDIRKALGLFTGNKITMSAGVALFSPKYPVSKMAEITGELESTAKSKEGKDSIALFGFESENHGDRVICKSVHGWKDFTESVCGEKLRLLRNCLSQNFGSSTANELGLGSSMVYKLMKLVREIDAEKDQVGGQINIARLLYTLARLQPRDASVKNSEQRLQANRWKRLYEILADSLYQWVRDDKDRLELLTALQLCVYYTRK